jgi:bifunctional DNA-binding transcriptional regulator/antitoxin component of YhaV-PrlF toxin-antitoxin module
MTQTIVIQVTADGQLTLPPQVQANLQPGDEYILWQEEDTIVLKKIQKTKGLSQLWQRIDELGDSEQPSLEEITAIVKEVRHLQ